MTTTIEKYQAFLHDLRMVCRKHNMALIGFCESEQILSEIQLVDLEFYGGIGPDELVFRGGEASIGSIR